MEIKDVLSSRYQILRRLGNEDSRTYLALDINFGCEVAVRKTDAKEMSSRCISFLFDEPCAVKILDRFSEDGENFLVLEYVRGSTLEEYLAQKNETMTKEAAWKMLRPAAAALEKARENGMPHGPLDPTHFLVQEDGTLKMPGLGYEEAAPENEQAVNASSENTASENEAAQLYGILCRMQKTEPEPEKKFRDIKDLIGEMDLLLPESETAKKEKTAGKKKIRPAVILVLAALLLGIAAAGIILYERQGNPDPRPAVVYAGNEIRGTEEYQKFTTFVKTHAISRKKDEDEGMMKGSMIYTLKPADIYAWGTPCNARRLDIKRDAFISGLEKEGVHATLLAVDDTCLNQVEIGQYGMINTDFIKRTDYSLENHAGMSIKSDMINDDITRIYFYWEQGYKGSDEELGIIAANALSVLTNDWNGDRDKTGRQLGKWLTYMNKKAGEMPAALSIRDLDVNYGDILGDKNGIVFSNTFGLGMKDGNFTYF